MMHSEQPAKLVHWFTEETNNMIHRCCQMFPGPVRRHGRSAADARGRRPTTWIPEMRRAVGELGFVGVLLNPDPTEGAGPPPPPLGDRYWYPVYEALCELDVPALIHSAGCKPPARESYSLHFILEETIAVDEPAFLRTSAATSPSSSWSSPTPAAPCPTRSVGSWPTLRRSPGAETYIDRMRTLWFDTCLYTKDAIELLFKTVGIDRCLFGSEKPGTGSVRNPENGHWFDDVRLLIEDIDWLSEGDRRAIFEGNAKSIFRLPVAES